MYSEVPSWNTPNMLLLRAIRAGRSGEAKLQLNPAIDYYRAHYLGNDSRLARRELSLLVREIQQRHSQNLVYWNEIVRQLESAMQEYQTRTNS